MQAISCILLSKGPLTVGIAPDWGACLTRFDLRTDARRIPLLRPARDVPPGVPRALGAACFPLVPYAGRLRNGQFDFEGRTVRFPLNAPPERHSSHGDGFTRKWSLTHLERHRAVMEILPEPGAPIRYRCNRTVEVFEDRLDVRMSLLNLEKRRIPVGMGLHPYFANRRGAILRANLPVRWHWDAELMPTHPGENEINPLFQRGIAAEHQGGVVARFDAKQPPGLPVLYSAPPYLYSGSFF